MSDIGWIADVMCPSKPQTFHPSLQCGSPLFQGKAKDLMLDWDLGAGRLRRPEHRWLALSRKQLADPLLDLFCSSGVAFH
jgi:hypothetical protein